MADFNPVVPKNYIDAEVLMLGNLHPSIQLSVIEQMVKRPKLIVLDTMNFWMNHTWDELLEVIAKVDIITIMMKRQDNSLENIHYLRLLKNHSMGPTNVVIKKGEHGALLFHNDNVFFAPALPLEEVFDPTGAGDTFAGGLVGYLTKTNDFSFENMKNGIIYGSNLASFCVEKFGTERMEDLSKEAIQKRYNNSDN